MLLNYIKQTSNMSCRCGTYSQLGDVGPTIEFPPYGCQAPKHKCLCATYPLLQVQCRASEHLCICDNMVSGTADCRAGHHVVAFPWTSAKRPATFVHVVAPPRMQWNARHHHTIACVTSRSFWSRARQTSTIVCVLDPHHGLLPHHGTAKYTNPSDGT